MRDCAKKKIRKTRKLMLNRTQEPPLMEITQILLKRLAGYRRKLKNMRRSGNKSSLRSGLLMKRCKWKWKCPKMKKSK